MIPQIAKIIRLNKFNFKRNFRKVFYCAFDFRRLRRLSIGHKAVGTVSMAELYINKKHFNIEHLAKIADVLEVDVCDFFKF